MMPKCKGKWMKGVVLVTFGLLVALKYRMSKIHASHIPHFKKSRFILEGINIIGHSTTDTTENDTSILGSDNFTEHSMNVIVDEANRKIAGYSFKTSSDDSILDVFIIPTSHNDPGWIQTFENYYQKQTKNIINNAVKYLTLYRNMTMIWPEIVFLEKWWENATEQQKVSLKNIISRGQLEIVTGGWVSPDEATCHYFAVLDQLIEGHQWLSRTLNVKPKACWPVDQFGYSTTLPYIWAKAGMKNLGLLRVTDRVKSYLAKHKMLDFSWRQQWDSSGANDVLCHVEPFVWFVTFTGCGPDTRICNRLGYHKQTEYLKATDIKKLATDLVKQFKMKSSLYKTNAIVIPLGADFAYDTEKEWISQYMKISNISNYINQNRNRFGVRIKFGTVSDYFDKISKTSDYPVVKGDFFTYVEGGNDYWSGYFTTRPFDKRIGRSLLELVRAAEMSTTFAILDSLQNKYPLTNISDCFRLLQNIHRQLGLFQHHDAITGTSTHVTATDYRKRLFSAIRDANSVMALNFENVLKGDKNVTIVPLLLQPRYDEPLRNILVNITEIQTDVFIWNPFTTNRREIVCIRVNDTEVKIMSDHNMEVKIQINPVWNSLGKTSDKVFDVCFEIDISTGSGTIYSISRARPQHNVSIARVGSRKRGLVSKLWPTQNIGQSMTFQNTYINVSFDKSGALSGICKLDTNNCSDVHLEWIMYERIPGDAYVFTADMRAKSMMSDIRNVRVVSGDIVTKVTLTHELFEHTVVMYNTTSIQGQFLHVENEVLFISSKVNGKELLMKMRTNIQNKDNSYYTDANGLQMVKRRYRSNMPSGANFYPMTTMVFIQDLQRRITLHSAQPLGVGSFKTGNIQVLIDRRPSRPGKGLTESVLDNRPATSRFFLLFEDINNQNAHYFSGPNNIFPSSFSSHVNDLLQNPVQLFLVKGNGNIKKELKLFSEELPQDIVIANLRTFSDENFAWKGTGITFHRKWVQREDIGKSNYTNKLTLGTLFNSIKPKHIHKSQLTYIDTENEVDKDLPVHLKSMDLDSYYFSWDDVFVKTN